MRMAGGVKKKKKKKKEAVHKEFLFCSYFALFLSLECKPSNESHTSSFVTEFLTDLHRCSGSCCRAAVCVPEWQQATEKAAVVAANTSTAANKC